MPVSHPKNGNALTRWLADRYTPAAGMPRDVALAVQFIDCSGSMSHAHNARQKYQDAVHAQAVHTIGAKELRHVYVVKVHLTGVPVTSKCAPFLEVKDEEVPLNGTTPQFEAANKVADDIRLFAAHCAKEGVTLKRTILSMVLDGYSSHEAPELVAAGFGSLVRCVAEYRAAVTLVAPSPEACHRPLLDQFAEAVGTKLQFLNSADPTELFRWELSDLFAATGATVGKSDPKVCEALLRIRQTAAK